MAAIVGSALLFGLAHGSIYRLLPTATLGVLLAYARMSTGSIAPGVIIHALNNGLAMMLLYYRPAWAERIAGEGGPACSRPMDTPLRSA